MSVVLIRLFVSVQFNTSEVDSLRKPKYRDNRIDILQSSFEYLSKSGLENISMRELCNGIGVSIGSVYYWFENKEQLIAETAEYGLLKVSDDIFSHVLKALDDIHSSFEICMDKIDPFFRLLSENRVFFAIIPKNLPSGKRESQVFSDQISPRGHTMTVNRPPAGRRSSGKMLQFRQN